MSFRYSEPDPMDYETYAEWEKDHDLWQCEMDSYCEEYLERRRGIL